MNYNEMWVDLISKQDEPTVWNDAVVKWHQFSKQMREECFTPEVIELCSKINEYHNLDECDIDLEIIKSVTLNESAIKMYFGLIDQFNLDRYATDLFSSLKVKKDFYTIISSINYELINSLAIFRTNYPDDNRPIESIKEDMETLSKANNILMKLGFDNVYIHSSDMQGNKAPRITRTFLQNIYEDLEKTLKVTNKKQYKPQALTNLNFSLVSPSNMSKYFMLDKISLKKYLREKIITPNTQRGMVFQKNKLLSNTLNDIAEEFINKNINKFTLNNNLS